MVDKNDYKMLDENGKPNFAEIRRYCDAKAVEEHDRQDDAKIEAELSETMHAGEMHRWVIRKDWYPDMYSEDTILDAECYSVWSFDEVIKRLKLDIAELLGSDVDVDGAYWLGDISVDEHGIETAESYFNWADDHSVSFKRDIPLLRIGKKGKGYCAYMVSDCWVPNMLGE